MKNLFIWLQGRPVQKIVNITKLMKTAKFTVICKTIKKVCEIYLKGCKEVAANTLLTQAMAYTGTF